jgi:hypothetical protein
MYSSEQIKHLRRNPNVERCTDKQITYTEDFKMKAVKQSSSGMGATDIFLKAGFDVIMFRKDFARDTIKRWKSTVKKGGLTGLSAESRGRPRKEQKVIDKESVEYLKDKIEYLEAENDFLAEMRGIKRD